MIRVRPSIKRFSKSGLHGASGILQRGNQGGKSIHKDADIIPKKRRELREERENNMKERKNAGRKGGVNKNLEVKVDDKSERGGDSKSGPAKGPREKGTGERAEGDPGTFGRTTRKRGSGYRYR